MATRPNKGSGSLATVPLALTSLALIGFLFTTYWQQQRDYQALQEELSLSRNNTKQALEQLNSQAALRHSALVKMSEDVAKLREQIESIQTSVKDQSFDMSQQGQKINGQVDRLNQYTQEQIHTLENIKTQLKERSDTYMNALIKQERELATLTAEKAVLTAATTNSVPHSTPPPTTPASSTTLPASTTPPPATTPSTPVATTPTTASIPASTASAPTRPTPLNPILPIQPTPMSTIRTTSAMPLPIPPIQPDMRGASGVASSGR